jgi:hypothetical protein
MRYNSHTESLEFYYIKGGVLTEDEEEALFDELISNYRD